MVVVRPSVTGTASNIVNILNFNSRSEVHFPENFMKIVRKLYADFSVFSMHTLCDVQAHIAKQLENLLK